MTVVGARNPIVQPRRYVARFMDAVLHIEVSGFESRLYSTPLGDVGFVSDYPLSALGDLAEHILVQGVAGLEGMPDNTIAFVRRYSRGSQEILAVRDAIGNTPLFAGGSPEDPVFASDIQSLYAATPSISRAIDTDAVGEYLLFRYTSGPRTLLQGVSQPVAGHLLRYADGNVSHLEWRDLRSLFGGGKFAEASRALGGLMQASLHREDVFDRLGVMFSGGLDSCYIASAVRRSDLVLYTLAFPGVGQADLQAAEVEAARLSLPFVPIEMDATAFADRLPGTITRFGWPIDHPNFVGRDTLFGRAAEDGIDRVLSGDGSDTIFGGAWYVSLAKALAAKRFTPSIFRHLPSFGRRMRQVKRVLSRSVEDLILFDKTYYSQARAAAISAFQGNSVAHLRAHLHAVADWDPLDQAFYLAHLTTLSVYPSAQRGMAWAWGVDVGYPFLDERVVRLANGVRGREKVAGFTAKRLFRETCTAVLTDGTIHRPKYGLPIPFADFIRGPGGMLRYQDLLRAADSVTEEMLEAREVRRILDRLSVGSHGPDDLELYWVLLNFEIWGRQFVRGEHVA